MAISVLCMHDCMRTSYLASSHMTGLIRASRDPGLGTRLVFAYACMQRDQDQILGMALERGHSTCVIQFFTRMAVTIHSCSDSIIGAGLQVGTNYALGFKLYRNLAIDIVTSPEDSQLYPLSFDRMNDAKHFGIHD